MRTGNPPNRRCVGAVWRRLQDDVYASEDVCWRCGRPVDKTLRLTAPRSPQAPSVDHVIPRKYRPDLALVRSNLRLAHYGCNSSRKASLTAKPQTRSRAW